jgi:acyl dehydratase
VGRWTDAFVGEEFGPLEFRLTEKLHRRYIDGVGNAAAEHADFVDPTVAGNFAIAVIGSRYPGPIIHSHQDLEFFAPVRVGETVVGTGVLSRKEMRRDKAYVAIDCDFLRGDERVWWARMTCIWPEVHLRREV